MSEKKPLIKRTTTDLENEEEKVWHKQQEAILKKWSEIGSSYRFMHDRSYTKYNTQNFRFALPVIIISTITGTANFAQGTFPTSWQPYVPLGIGFLNLSAGLLTTVAQFLRVSELLEGHRAAAIAYSKFSRNISVELSLPREERTTGGTEFVNTCRNELDRLIEQSPNIPLEIIKQFGKRFENTEFMKPEILNITSVQVYRDDKKEKAKQKLEEIKQNEMIRKKFLEGEQQRRESIIAEIMKEQKLQQDNMQRQLEMTKKRKKDNIGISSVEHSMKKLISKLQDADKNNDILTPSSSDQSGDEISPINERNTKKVVAQIEDVSTVQQPLVLDTVVEIAQEDDGDGNTNDGDEDSSSGGPREEEISNVVLDITDTSGNDI
tara:strand:- start:192 stop:1328 length:1137 start_codon:yes stop_codon:yes gene_type:complete